MALGTSYYVNGRRMDPATFQRYQGMQALSNPANTGYVGSGAPALWSQRYGQAMDLTGQLSDQERMDILRRYGNLAATAQNQLVGGGLQATTIMPSVLSGIERYRSADLRALNDQLLRERLGIMGDYTQGQAGAMMSDAARRTAANQYLRVRPGTTGTVYNGPGVRNVGGGTTTRYAGSLNAMPGGALDYRARYA